MDSLDAVRLEDQVLGSPPAEVGVGVVQEPLDTTVSAARCEQTIKAADQCHEVNLVDVARQPMLRDS